MLSWFFPHPQVPYFMVVIKFVPDTIKNILKKVFEHFILPKTERKSKTEQNP